MNEWIGKYYQYGFCGYDNQGVIVTGSQSNQGKRVLVVDLDCYIDSTDSATLVQEYIDFQSIEGPIPKLNKFDKAFSGAIMSEEDIIDFWNHIALYNYNGEFSLVNPLEDDSNEVKSKKFEKIIRKIRPDIVFIWSRRYSSSVEMSAENISDIIKSDEFDDLKLYVCSKIIDELNISIIPIHHPLSTEFRIDYYHELFLKLFPSCERPISNNVTYSIENSEDEYYRLALVWNKFLSLTSSSYCQSWSIDYFNSYAKRLWTSLCADNEIEIRRRNSINPDNSIVIVDSSYLSNNGEIIYLAIQVLRDGSYYTVHDILLEKDLESFHIKTANIPKVQIPESVNDWIRNLKLDRIYLTSERNTCSRLKGDYKGGTRGHLLIDGLDNFPLSYRLAKHQKCGLPHTINECSFDSIITEQLRSRFREYIDFDLHEEVRSEPGYVVLREVFQDFMKYINHAFWLVERGIIEPVAYYYGTGAQIKTNIAFPLFDYNGFPICVITNRIQNREEGTIVPVTILTLDEIRLDIRIYGENGYTRPKWLELGYRLESNFHE